MPSPKEAGRRSPAATAHTGLLLIDVMNSFDFEGADKLAPRALAAAPKIRKLRDAADRRDVPVVYVNDNYGHWTSDREQIIEEIRQVTPQAGQVADLLAPRASDYFVIKPQLSGFYATNLAALLPRLEVSRLVLAGFAVDICVLFTAADAHMREYDLWVPRDAVAGEHAERATWALEIIENSFGADTSPTGELTLEAWIARG